MLQRVLNARQFGLKMIANVSYGYTAAGFSGRLPFAELADSIVQSGRQTLENAIRLVRVHLCMCVCARARACTHACVRGKGRRPHQINVGLRGVGGRSRAQGRRGPIEDMQAL